MAYRRIGPKYDDFVPRLVQDEKDGAFVAHPWFDLYVFNGSNTDGQPDARVQCNYNATYKNCVAMHEAITPPIKSRKKLHFERGVSSKHSAYFGVSKDQRAMAGRWQHERDSHDTSYANGLPFDSMRFKAGLPPDAPGHFYVLRNLVDAPEALKFQVYASLVPLRTAILNGTFPEAVVGDTLQGFLDVVDYFSGILLQDAACLYENMSSCQLYSCVPFNTPEFSRYRDELLAAMRVAPAANLRITLRESQLRGDARTAAVLATVLCAQGAAPCVAAPGFSPMARLELRELHQAIVPERPSLSLSPLQAPRILFQAAHPDGAAVAALRSPSGPAGCDVRNVATWPTDTVPTFAIAFVLGDYSSPEELADEWLRGRNIHFPPVKMLESYYGPGKDAKVKGYSWRSKHWTTDKTNKKDTAFSKRKAGFDYITEHGEAAALAEMHRLLSLFEGEGEKRSWRAMQHVLGQMRAARPGAAKRKSAALERAAARKRLETAPS